MFAGLLLLSFGSISAAGAVLFARQRLSVPTAVCVVAAFVLGLVLHSVIAS